MTTVLTQRGIAGLLLSMAVALAAPRAAGAEGVIIREIAQGPLAVLAGLQPGDRIVAVVPPGGDERSAIAINSPFDLTHAEVEHADRGAVTLRLRRGAAPHAVVLAAGPWGLSVEPVLNGPVGALHQAGRDAFARQDVREGEARLREAAATAAAARRPALAAWLLWTTGELLRRARATDAAQDAYAAALPHADADGVPHREAPIWESRALAYVDQGELALARDAWVRAAAARDRAVPGGLGGASAHCALGELARTRGDPVEADRWLTSALTRAEEHAPEGALLARTLSRLGDVRRLQGRVDEAHSLLARAAALQEHRPHRALDLTDTLNARAWMALFEEDAATSAGFLKEAMALVERAAPGSLLMADTHDGFGAVFQKNSDRVAAEHHLRRALAVRLALAPQSLRHAASLHNLGRLLWERGDAAGEDLLRQGLAIQERLAPDGLEVARSHMSLGLIAWGREDWRAMGERYQRALPIQRRLTPGTVQEAWSIYALGIVALNQGRYAEAEERLGEAASLQERLQPEGAAYAYALSGLALLHRSQGRLGQAAEYLTRAIEAGEAPRRRAVSAAQRAGHGAFFAHFHRDLVEILAEAGRHEEAFQAMERYRARSLLAILTERDLVTPSLPDVLVREREEFQLEYDRALAAVKATVGKGPEEAAVATTRLHRLRMQREELAARIRNASPAATALQDPAPLASGEAFTLLDPGTALLSYSVGSKRTVLVVLTGPPKAVVRTFVIPAGEVALRERVDRFRALIASRATRQALHEAGAALYRDLVGPAAPWVASAERVAISPDGPLHVLPFAALRQPAAPGHPSRFLAEWKPLHVVPSATVFRDLKRTRRPPRVPARVVAFGDPKYPIEALPKESPLRSRLLEPLPGSRREVDAITRLFGARARSHLDRDASERRVKGIGRDVDYLHFAVHGLVDERVPEHSALALTSSEDTERPENGLLQVWEILDEVRLDTELVTLSACESGLGGEMPGEGIIGLTRAFLYAGSRSVVASLWAVFDSSTVIFMEAFYRHLLAGRPKAEALQAAQRDALAHPERAAPLIWAAFQVYGDWR